jgi:PhnB protein
MPDTGCRTPKALGGTPVGLMLYVDDVDAVFARALAAGGTVKQPVKDQFYGDRSGTLADPYGHLWTVATHFEDVTLEEVRHRFAGVTAGA